jgi:hypothetical protein
MKKNTPAQTEFKSREVASIFESYPEKIRKKLLFLRQLILETTAETGLINELEETLKWGEPSYLTKSGSTIRIDWKKSKPDQYAVYFHYKTKLIETFKELYRNTFTFEGNRAIILNENEAVPINELKHCLELSLTYHKIKHLPLLGA